MNGSDILVVVPHCGINVPAEIFLEDLSYEFPALLKNIDWYTQWLYDFRDILGNRQITFPYCSILLEANRDPDDIEQSVPLVDIHGQNVYRPGFEPTEAMRKGLSDKYLKAFHRRIEEAIAAGTGLLLDGHSTVTARGVRENQIELMNFQQTENDEKPLYYCPDIIVETYAEELRSRLPDVLITVNESEFFKVHGHVCAAHCVNDIKRVGAKTPAFIQETNERLFKNEDDTPNITQINRLRRAFAESLAQTVHFLDESRKTKMINLHPGTQLYNYDCGPRALQTVMHYYGEDVGHDELIAALGTTEDGTPPEEMIRVAKQYGFAVKSGSNWSLKQVKQYVDEGTPVIVLLQAWADRIMTLDDWRRDWENGHYAIIIGLNKGMLLFEDPSSVRRTWLREREFLARWHDMHPKTVEKYEHFGMVLLGKQPAVSSFEHMD